MPWRHTLWLIKHHTMKMHGWVEVELHMFLSLSLDGSMWSPSCLSCFTPGEISPSTHLIGGWFAPRTSLGMVVKRKITFPCLESNPGRPVTILTQLSASPSLKLRGRNNMQPSCFSLKINLLLWHRLERYGILCEE